MDEVFGEANFLAQVVVNLNAKGRQLGKRVREQPRVPPRLRPRRPLHGARREQRRHRRRARLPADRAGRPPLPAPAAAQHQQEVQPGHRADPALHDLGRPETGAGAHRRRSTARRRSARSSATAGRRSGAGAGPLIDAAPRRPGLPPVHGRRGERVDVFQKDWLHRRAPQEAAHDLAGRGGRLHRHRGRRAQGDRRATSSSRPSRPG